MNDSAFFRRTVALILGVIAVPAGVLPTTRAAGVARLDRWNLLEYHSPTGEAEPAITPGDWEIRRREILDGMQAVTGWLPGPEKRTPLHPEVLERVDCGAYVRLLITYEPEPKGLVPAYLLIPKKALAGGGAECPGVLCLHPTDARLGFKVVAGLGGATNDAYAKELAERGFVAIAPAYPLLANYQPDLKALGYESGTMKAIWDNIRALDYLDTLPFVRHGRYGAIGHSLGGHNAIFTAEFDPRIQAVVSSCGFDSFLDYKGGDIRGWTSPRYMPRLLNWRVKDIPFDFPELIGALAPRACFISAPFYDNNFQWRSVLRIEEAARPVYAFLGAADRLRVEYPKCGHEFPKEIREQAYQFLEENLKR